MLSRILKIILLLAILCLATYLKINHEFTFSNKTNRNLDIGISIIMALVFLRLILELFSAWYSLNKRITKSDQRDNILVGLSNLFTILSTIIILLGLLSIFGLNPSQVFTSLSIVAAAIAVIAKEFFAELVIGVVNGFSNKVDVGDYIKSGIYNGVIEDIGLQKVTIINSDGKKIYLPNIKFHSEELINYTKMDSSFMTLDFQLSNEGIDFTRLEQTLIHALKKLDSFVDPSYHELKVKQITKESVDFKFKYILREVDMPNHNYVNGVLTKEIFSLLQNKKDQA
jgi:small-conductance mechanosensitive channel